MSKNDSIAIVQDYKPWWNVPGYGYAFPWTKYELQKFIDNFKRSIISLVVGSNWLRIQISNGRNYWQYSYSQDKIYSGSQRFLIQTTKLLFGPATTVAKPSSDVHILAYLYTEIKSLNYCNSQLQTAATLVKQYRAGLEPPNTTKEHVYAAKSLYESAYHPGTGEKMVILGQASDSHTEHCVM